jgi:hypothetical protein
MFDDSFTETQALSIPKLNVMFDCDSKLGLVPSHLRHFNKSLLFCTMQFGQFHVPDGFLHPSPNKTAPVDTEDNTGVGLVVKTEVFVSQA